MVLWGYVLIWYVRRDGLRVVEEGINPALWTETDKYISELIA